MNNSTLKIALCQYSTVWNNPLTNFSIIEELNSGIESDILILPEMFDTGFITNPKELADPLAIKSKKWLEAQSNKQVVLGSVANKRGDSFYNSLLVYYNQNQLLCYDKVHTFIGDERQNYTAGNQLGVFKFNDWKISVNICYDLRFPVWCRAQKTDLMIFCANWPAGRKEHWHALLKARAIENQCYVVGANRIGLDNNDWFYKGQSVVFDFKGKELLNLAENEICESISLSKEELQNYRLEFPFLQDKDDFTLKNITNAQ